MRVFFVVLFFMAVSILKHKSDGYIDVLEEFGCHETEFRLSCNGTAAKIAIFEAIFLQTNELVGAVNDTCENLARSIKKRFCANSSGSNNREIIGRHFEKIYKVNFRHALNRRCSGVKYCTFAFEQHFDEGPKLGSGGVLLRYTCVKDTNLTKSCNSNISVERQGLARSPGYPSYYIGEITCQWTLKAPTSQRIKVTFLDVSIRGIAPFDTNCLDWIIVSENGLNLFKNCGDVVEDVVIHSQGSALNVSFVTTSKTIYPKRGFLFHYKAVGCLPLKKPEDGYIIVRNNSYIHFRCCVGFLFRDTLSRDKILQCHNENTWNGNLSDCISLEKLQEEGLYQFVNESIDDNLTAETISIMEPTDPIKDVILPALVIGALLIGNGVLLYVIYRQKKKLFKTEESIKLQPILNRQIKDEDCQSI